MPPWLSTIGDKHWLIVSRSLLICTWGVALHVLGVILKVFNEGPWVLSSIVFKIGWVGNVTGFSLVLFSRLNLVVHDRRIRRGVLAMIITDAMWVGQMYNGGDCLPTN
jgi:hypothetical protein